MHCNYCHSPATARIPSVASEVCLTHAIEFWTGLLAYAKEHAPSEPIQCAPRVGRHVSRPGRPEPRPIMHPVSAGRRSHPAHQ